MTRSPTLEAVAAEAVHSSRCSRRRGWTGTRRSVLRRLLVLTDMMGRRTHGLAMAPLYLTAIEKGAMRRHRRARGRQGHGCDDRLGWRLSPWALARQSCHRSRAAARGRAWRRIGGDSQESPHRLSRRAGQAGRRSRLRRDHREFGSGRPSCRALRRHRAAVHAESVRHRLSRRAASRARGHLRVDHHDVDDAREVRRGRAVRASVAARRARRSHARSRRARASTAAGIDPVDGRAGVRAQRASDSRS